MKDRAIGLWTGLLGFLARNRPVVLAVLSVVVSATAGVALQNLVSNWQVGVVTLVGIFFIVFIGLIDSRFARAELVAFMLPAVHRVLNLNQTDRITVHVLRAGHEPTYQQLTDYYPKPEQPTRGRVFPLSHGIVAQSFHTHKPLAWSVPPGRNFEEAMLERWPMNPEQLRRVRQDRRSFLAYPIGQEGNYARAVLYMDSADPDRFAEAKAAPYYQQVSELFLPQLTEALRNTL